MAAYSVLNTASHCHAASGRITKNTTNTKSTKINLFLYFVSIVFVVLIVTPPKAA